MKKKSIFDLHRVSQEEFKHLEKIPLVVVLDNVRSLNNIGSVFRTADAFKVACIYLCGITATPPHTDIHKTALGAEDSVDWIYEQDTCTVVDKLLAAGYEVYAIEQVEGSISLNDIELDKATIKSMYRKNLRLMADSGVIDEDQFNRISDAFTKWYSGEDRGALLRLNAAIFNDEKKIKAAGEFYALGHYPQSECKEYYDAYPLVNELLYYYDKGFTDAWYVDNVGSFLIVIERKKE